MVLPALFALIIKKKEPTINNVKYEHGHNGLTMFREKSKTFLLILENKNEKQTSIMGERIAKSAQTDQNI